MELINETIVAAPAVSVSLGDIEAGYFYRCTALDVRGDNTGTCRITFGSAASSKYAHITYPDRNNNPTREFNSSAAITPLNIPVATDEYLNLVIEVYIDGINTVNATVYALRHRGAGSLAEVYQAQGTIFGGFTAPSLTISKATGNIVQGHFVMTRYALETLADVVIGAPITSIVVEDAVTAFPQQFIIRTRDLSWATAVSISPVLVVSLSGTERSYLSHEPSVTAGGARAQFNESTAGFYLPTIRNSVSRTSRGMGVLSCFSDFTTFRGQGFGTDNAASGYATQTGGQSVAAPVLGSSITVSDPLGDTFSGRVSIYRIT